MKFSGRGILSGALAAIAICGAPGLAEAQDERVVFEGSFVVGSPQQPQGADELLAALDGPYLPIEARFIHESWVLLGQPVHSCEIRWDYIGRRGLIWVEGFDFDLTDPTVAMLLENHPDIEVIGQTVNQSATRQGFADGYTLAIRPSALSELPRVYDLDFLIDMSAGAANTRSGRRESGRYDGEHPFTSDDGTVLDSPSPGGFGNDFFVRCTSGYLGTPDNPGFNTPYSPPADQLIVNTLGDTTAGHEPAQIGRASCRERVFPVV